MQVSHAQRSARQMFQVKCLPDCGRPVGRTVAATPVCRQQRPACHTVTIGAAQSLHAEGVVLQDNGAVGETSAKKAPRNKQAWNRRCAPRQRPPSGRERQVLQVISEEASYPQARRRKQLIPRARLVHHGRPEEPTTRSPSLHFRLITRARPLLLSPPIDFRSDDRTAAPTVGAGETRRRVPPAYVIGNAKIFHDTFKAEYTDTKKGAALTNETTTARRTGNSHKIITSGSVNNCSSNAANTAHRPVAQPSTFSTSDGPSANGAQNSHKAAAEPTEQIIQTFVQETKDGVPDFGKEITQVTRLRADVQARIRATGIGRCTNAPENTTEEDPERTTDFPSNSIRSSHGESANKLKLPKADLLTNDTACTDESANKAAGTNKRITEQTVHSVTIFQRHSRDSARTHAGQPEKKNRKSTDDNETRQNNVYTYLSGKARTVQDSAGSTAKTAPHFPGKGRNKAQRVDGDKERRTENFVFKTSNQTEDKTCEERETDPANGIERKIQFAVSDKNHINNNANVIRSVGRGPKINQDTVNANGISVQECSNNKFKKAHNDADVKDGEDKYSAGEKRKRAHSSGDKTQQTEVSARDRKATQHSLSGKVKKTEGILIERNKTKGVTGTKNRIKNLAEGKDHKREYSAQEVGGSATVEEQNTEGTDSFLDSIGLGGEHNAMSRRPQVLKIKDSTPTASRHDEKSHVNSGERPEECQTERLPARSEEQPESEENSVTTTRTLRSFFEGGTETALFQTDMPKQNKVPGPVATTRRTCEEDADKMKPKLSATLSMEDPRNASPKLHSRTKISSSPDKNTYPRKSLPSGETPASRALSCSGKGTLSTVTRSIPGDLNPLQHKRSHQSSHTDRDSKVAAFDGLLQYLQDYKHGLREMLVNNNVVIIEPVRQSRTKLEDWKSSAKKSTSESTCRITGATVKKSSSTLLSNTLPRQQKSQQPILRRHFFYHPIRTNRSLVDEELPDPDKVRHAREMFERTMKIKDPCKEEISNANDTVNTKNSNKNSAPTTNGVSKADNKNANKVKRKYLTVDTVFRHNVWHKRWTDSGSLSSGVSSDLSCYETDVDSHDTSSRKEEPTDIFSSDDNDHPDKNYYPDDSDEGHYVAPEVMERIRACGTTVTYYGGQVIAASNGPVRSPMTLAIMDEIQRNKNTSKQGNRIIQDEYLGVKFRLVKSNSCGSRLELAGTEGDEKWNCTAKQSHNEKHESWNTEGTPNAEKCQQQLKVSDIAQNAHKDKEYAQSGTAQSSTTGSPDSLSPRLNENGPIFGERHAHYAYIRGGPPQEAKVLERGNNSSFVDMEFEEYQVAEDSLNVTEDTNIECKKTNEASTGQKHQQVRQAASNDINICAAAAEEQPRGLQNSGSKENNDVQMITWASRSAQFE